MNACLFTSPPDDPPGVRRVSNGLLVLPVTLLYVSQHWHSSGVLLTSSGIAPADLSDATAVASLDAILSLGVSRPALLLMPGQGKLYINGQNNFMIVTYVDKTLTMGIYKIVDKFIRYKLKVTLI